jgi:nicotinate-nucleotide--dimethylbenzimidazole phosphoribosyltransferase
VTVPTAWWAVLHTCPMSPAATDLLALGADVQWTDGEAGAAAAAAAPVGNGRLAELAQWHASTRGGFPATMPARARCVVVGAVTEPVAVLAESLGVGTRSLPLPEADAVAAGVAAADDEVETGADLIVLAGADPTAAPAAVVALLTGAEPVALLPRGAGAIDTTAWIERAARLRDLRRELAGLRDRPEELLAALDSPALAAATGFLLRAVSRRTPVLLDGTCAVVAALVCRDIQPRAGRWWRTADVSPDPVHVRAIDEFGHRPLLELGTRRDDGAAGLLAVCLLRAAITLGGGDE